MGKHSYPSMRIQVSRIPPILSQIKYHIKGALAPKTFALTPIIIKVLRKALQVFSVGVPHPADAKTQCATRGGGVEMRVSEIPYRY